MSWTECDIVTVTHKCDNSWSNAQQYVRPSATMTMFGHACLPVRSSTVGDSNGALQFPSAMPSLLIDLSIDIISDCVNLLLNDAV